MQTLRWNQWARHILHQRENSSLLIPFAFRRLFQQFLVDIYAVSDQSTLQWHLYNQKKIRADLFNIVFADHVAGLDGDAAAGAQIGRKVLPSSYVGGIRFIKQCYQDSMAIVRKLGQPSLFIMITANPRWPEIQAELLPGQTANNRPDVVGRVFGLKCRAILKEIRDGCFGKFANWVWTTEYQKRGLPHRHLLLILAPNMPAS